MQGRAGFASAGPVVWAPFAALESDTFLFDGVRWFLEMPDAAVPLKERTILLCVDGATPQLLSRDVEYLYVRMSGPPFRLVARFALPPEAQGTALCMQATGRNACQLAFGTGQGAIMAMPCAG